MARSSSSSLPRPHFVVDGSNIATEGRSLPSLKQLNEAVLAFMEERPDVLITVVVDATFGHRIEKKEVKEFDAAVANNELVTPPAGAVGRGDAFVLSIAHKAKASILSNDSFQEFHGDYDWLFDQGRLIGGKPVPHVGWVFVERTPVRGPRSRQAVKEAKQGPEARSGRKRGGTSSGSPLANEPMPTPKSPPPGRRGPATDDGSETETETETATDTATPVETGGGKSTGRGRGRGRGKERAAATAEAAEAPANLNVPAFATVRAAVNDLVPFLDFVERHPVGTSCNVVVESYSSHGAYARADDVLVYIPLRLMADPPPRSARSVISIGSAVTVVVAGYFPERRSVDAALPAMAGSIPAPPEPAPAKRRTRKKSAADDVPTEVEVASPSATAEADVPKPSRGRRKRAADTDPSPDPSPAVAEAPAKRSRAKRSASGSADPAAKTSSAKKTAAKKTAARDAAAPVKKSTAKKTAAKKSTTEKSAAKKTAAKKSVAKKAPAKKTTTKKSTAAKTAASRTAGRRSRPKAE